MKSLINTFRGKTLNKPYCRFRNFNSNIFNIQNTRKIPDNKNEIKNKTRKMIKANDIIYNALVGNEVNHAFIFSGGSIMPVIDRLYNSQISYTVNSHEQNCGHAATGYAKTSNKTGVVMVTSGPGITNMITPMLDATNDSTPLVVISGQVSLNSIGTNAFQEAPAVDLSKHVTKWSYQVKTIEELDKVINKAFYIANSGKKGAVHIDIPKCISSGSIDFKKYNFIKKNTIKRDSIFTKIKNAKKYYNISGIEDVIQMINMCEKPILYIGQGCTESYDLLRKFAIESNIPVTSTIHGCGIFDESHPLSLQWCGMHGNPAANFALQQADCIIALGSRFDDRTTGNVEKYAPCAYEAYKDDELYGGIVHVNIEPSEIGKAVNSHHNFHVDCKEFLKEAVKYKKYNPRDDWIKTINNLKKKYKFKYLCHENKLYMENVFHFLYNKTKDLNDKVIFTTGVGNHQMQAYQFIKSHYPKKIISSGSLGVMGAGLPYAIGAQTANPDKTVICIDGDSSFNMTLTDMKTIVEKNLPIKIAIMNNNSQMMVTIWEKLFFEKRYAATINEKNPSFTKLAESYGIKSLKCDNRQKLNQIINEFLNYNDGPILCEFNIEKTMCLPLVAPGKALDEMIFEDDGKFNIDSNIAPS